ncbi:type I-E CRISPR-associated protein Cas7/Cse4/CasC [Azospirillum sp. B21]|uniref:type I-E CRISPR-associated protein Cas7/Cse4/CasC n=1 Tax=Azospirillum sp. B21 TaxID=2607496 RepID=UPI0011EEDA58|nr:type I-E CRISPR-associated protein Cas7/Cse4/CasC [Azospirillum sp. B21]KAA0577424.1 type I-E CRISPR-associated protein Cas7/Cse4/CasC [Azospirillum sp. B21]
MTNPRFLQIHTLTPYAAALLNRDDAGAAKRLPFGGSIRTRISSQCLKRHWRRADHEWELKSFDPGLSLRSRRIFSERVALPLIGEGFPAEQVVAVVGAIQALLLGESPKAKKEKKGKAAAGTDAEADPATLVEALETKQVIVLGEPEVAYLREAARTLLRDPAAEADPVRAVTDWAKAGKANLAALNKGAGIDAALFGRMVTSDHLARCDAAIHVAHAFTVHAQELENDYFSAVDDLAQESGETGSGHINTTELTSGLFYGYVAIDVPLLVSNLGHDTALAGQVVERLIHTVATVSPGAKLGSTAPHSWSVLVLAEMGGRTPRSLANAFLNPVPLRGGDVAAAAVERLTTHVAALDAMYGAGDERRVASILDGSEALGTRLPLGDLAGWAAGSVAANGRAE